MRLCLHENATQVQPCASGAPWLGFVIFPTHRRLKGRKARMSAKHLNQRYRHWQRGDITFAEFDTSVQAWVAHASHADTHGLRQAVLQHFDISQAFRQP